MAAPSKFFYTISPDGIDSLSKKDRKELLDSVGEYLKFTILDLVGQSESPVARSPNFKDKKDGEVSVLDENGDLLDSLDFKVSKSANSLEIGFFDKLEAAKAFGHASRMEGHPWLENKVPRRQIIPFEDQVFKKEIRDGIESIIQEFLDANQD
jgi:hypothetical protein